MSAARRCDGLGALVLPASAVTLVDGRARLYFCFDACDQSAGGRRRARAGEHRIHLRADIVEIGRRYARGYTASNDGNISVRLGSDRLLMTPSVCKGFMTPDMMCITDLEGRKLQGDRDPSSEMLMHLEVYRQRPDVQAVVHASADRDRLRRGRHPARPRGARRSADDARQHPDRGDATPSTKELPQAVGKYIRRTTACCWRTTAR